MGLIEAGHVFWRGKSVDRVAVAVLLSVFLARLAPPAGSTPSAASRRPRFPVPPAIDAHSGLEVVQPDRHGTPPTNIGQAWH